ncbi:hypothetical protein PoB_005453600 [Plakobranchus ocellatus]|uniref:TNFR-Cys domain-containing protein n=1 Tax=Plakobranchus ocellatus TaxID=259542 RepID=A0AAV4BY09_9GAST|nr:hypothetical protein PoB_005453600 [Plakobranchus ocellatus]
MANIRSFLRAFGPLLVLCFCLNFASLAHGRTVIETEDEQNDGQDEELPDTYDHWPILCPPNNWYSKKQENCLPCSACPEDQFIIRPCYRFQDTRCALLRDFPGHFLSPPSSGGHSRPLVMAGDGKLRNSGRGSQQSEDQWRPAAVVLGVITGVLVTALLVTSLAVCVVWKRQQAAESRETEKKLVCAYSPAPSVTV